MAMKISPEARRQIAEIYDYTVKEWGARQAASYTSGLLSAAKSLGQKKGPRRPVPKDTLEAAYIGRYKHHFLIYRILSFGDIALLLVLHEQMNLPSRLEEYRRLGDTDPR